MVKDNTQIMPETACIANFLFRQALVQGQSCRPCPTSKESIAPRERVNTADAINPILIQPKQICWIIKANFCSRVMVLLSCSWWVKNKPNANREFITKNIPAWFRFKKGPTLLDEALTPVK